MEGENRYSAREKKRQFEIEEDSYRERKTAWERRRRKRSLLRRFDCPTARRRPMGREQVLLLVASGGCKKIPQWHHWSAASVRVVSNKIF